MIRARELAAAAVLAAAGGAAAVSLRRRGPTVETAPLADSHWELVGPLVLHPTVAGPVLVTRVRRIPGAGEGRGYFALTAPAGRGREVVAHADTDWVIPGDSARLTFVLDPDRPLAAGHRVELAS